MTTNASLVIVARSVRYYSASDERAFFEWLQRIDGFDHVKGIGEELHIHIKEDIDEYGLRDLVALFFRYNVDLTQIPKVVSTRQHPWLLKRNMYWFSAMFPDDNVSK